jgi:hypothetical protein
MSEKRDISVREQDESVEAPPSREAYEPPALRMIGTLRELTGQELKVSSGADLVNFQPSHT